MKTHKINKKELYWIPICGQYSLNYLKRTWKLKEVTCKNCLKKLNK